MFKRAYARAVMTGLVHAGQAAFPDDVKAAAVADYIADRMEIPLFDEKTGAAIAVPRAVTAKIAGYIIDSSNEYKKAGHTPGTPAKIASVDDLGKHAHAHVLHLMKQAEGSTIEGGDKGNAEPHSAEGKMDAAARPNGYAEDSRGKTDVDTKPGAVGKEAPHPNKPSVSPSGDNSVVDQARTAALGEMIKKMAEGSTILGGDKGNKEPHSAEGKMDMTHRPEGYARLPHQGAPGEIPTLVTGPAIVGRETPHPSAPANSPSGSNSVIEHSQKAAEDAAYVLVFKKTAAEVGQHLPASLTEDEKIAHIKLMMGYSLEQKAAHIHALQKTKTAAAATVAAPPAPPESGRRYDGRNGNQKQGGIEDMLASMKDKDEKKDGDKKDEKKEDEKEKDASLLDRIRNLSAAAPVA